MAGEQDNPFADTLRGAFRAARGQRRASVVAAQRTERAIGVMLFEGPPAEWAGEVLAVLNVEGALAAGTFDLLPGGNGNRALQVLTLPAEAPAQFGYPQVREIGVQVLKALGAALPQAAEVGLVLPGPELGLDRVDCVEHFLQGVASALAEGQHPPGLRRVVLIEPGRTLADVLRATLSHLLEAAELDEAGAPAGWRLAYYPAAAEGSAEARVPAPFEARLTHQQLLTAFVAMPFASEMMSTFVIGIQRPARAAGFRAERLDLEHYTGDVLEKIRERIQRAHLVIADLTQANPNVFLEIGYAWGKGRPTVLLWHKPERSGKNRKPQPSPPFDVRGQVRIDYKDLLDLERQLGARLRALHPTLKTGGPAD
jgi:hypothetical protein